MTKSLFPAAAIALLMVTVPAMPLAAQQQSESYKFLQAVKEAKGNDVIAMLDKPGSSIINARDISSGEGAVHIVIKRGDETYLRYLLQKGADANLRDRQGNTPLILAVQQGQRGMIPILTAAKANANLSNQSGVTPLILAVQGRDIDMVRQLLAAGANPDQADRMAGQSARDYATNDPRNTAIAKLFADTPKRQQAAVAGPTLR
jgi:ankyrin repeat protein